MAMPTVYTRSAVEAGLVSTLTAVLGTAAACGVTDRGFGRGVLVTIKAQADLYGVEWVEMRRRVEELMGIGGALEAWRGLLLEG